MDKLYVAKVVSSTSTDGVGLRNSLYVSGCHLRCDGCHNAKFWPIKSGTERTIKDVFAELNQDDFNISILGGEPLMQYPAILELCKLIKKKQKRLFGCGLDMSFHTLRYSLASFLRMLMLSLMVLSRKKTMFQI